MFKKFILIFPLIYLYLKDNKFFTNVPPPRGKFFTNFPPPWEDWLKVYPRGGGGGVFGYNIYLI